MYLFIGASNKYLVNNRSSVQYFLMELWLAVTEVKYFLQVFCIRLGQEIG